MPISLEKRKQRRASKSGPGAHLNEKAISRGGIARQAAYQTADDLTVVTRWYAALVPGAEMHATSDCVSLWQSRVILHVQRSIGLRLCQVRSGTRIVVNERVDIWP